MKQPHRNPQSRTPSMTYATNIVFGAMRLDGYARASFLPHLAENNQKCEHLKIVSSRELSIMSIFLIIVFVIPGGKFLAATIFYKITKSKKFLVLGIGTYVRPLIRLCFIMDLQYALVGLFLAVVVEYLFAIRIIGNSL